MLNKLLKSILCEVEYIGTVFDLYCFTKIIIYQRMCFMENYKDYPDFLIKYWEDYKKEIDFEKCVERITRLFEVAISYLGAIMINCFVTDLDMDGEFPQGEISGIIKYFNNKEMGLGKWVNIFERICSYYERNKSKYSNIVKNIVGFYNKQKNNIKDLTTLRNKFSHDFGRLKLDSPDWKKIFENNKKRIENFFENLKMIFSKNNNKIIQENDFLYPLIKKEKEKLYIYNGMLKEKESEVILSLEYFSLNQVEEKNLKKEIKDNVILSSFETKYNQIISKYEYYFHNQTTRIEELCYQFVGRRKIIDDIKQEIDNNKNRKILIQGDMGKGKSSIIAKLIKDEYDINMPHHFINHNDGADDIKLILKSLIDQIRNDFLKKKGVFIPDEYSKLVKTFSEVVEKFSDVYKKPKRKRDKQTGKIKKIEKLIIFIDAIDELNESTLVGTNYLDFITDSLPDNVYIIASSKNSKYIQNSKFDRVINLNNCAFEEEDLFKIIDNTTGENVISIEIKKQLYKKYSNEIILLTSILKDKDYITKILDENFDIDTLPKNITELYDRFIKKLEKKYRTTDDYSTMMKILSVIYVMKKAISATEIKSILKGDFYKVDVLFKELLTILNENNGVYTFHHNSFRIYLSDKKLIDEIESHKYVAEYLGTNIEREYGNDRDFDYDYAFDNYFYHLTEAGQQEKVLELINTSETNRFFRMKRNNNLQASIINDYKKGVEIILNKKDFGKDYVKSFAKYSSKYIKEKSKVWKEALENISEVLINKDWKEAIAIAEIIPTQENQARLLFLIIYIMLIYDDKSYNSVLEELYKIKDFDINRDLANYNEMGNKVIQFTVAKLLALGNKDILTKLNVNDGSRLIISMELTEMKEFTMAKEIIEQIKKESTKIERLVDLCEHKENDMALIEETTNNIFEKLQNIPENEDPPKIIKLGINSQKREVAIYLQKVAYLYGRNGNAELFYKYYFLSFDLFIETEQEYDIAGHKALEKILELNILTLDELLKKIQSLKIAKNYTLVNLVIVLIHLKRFDEAKELIKELKEPDRIKLEAILLIIDNKTNEAKTFIENTSEEIKKDILIHIGEIGKPELAFEIYNNFETDEKLRIEKKFWITSCFFYYNRNEYEKAFKYCEELIPYLEFLTQPSRLIDEFETIEKQQKGYCEKAFDSLIEKTIEMLKDETREYPAHLLNSLCKSLLHCGYYDKVLKLILYLKGNIMIYNHVLVLMNSGELGILNYASYFLISSNSESLIKEGINTYKTAIIRSISRKIIPKDISSLNLLAFTFSKSGNQEKAEEVVKYISDNIGLVDSTIQTKIEIAKDYYKSNDIESAKRIIEESIYTDREIESLYYLFKDVDADFFKFIIDIIKEKEGFEGYLNKFYNQYFYLFAKSYKENSENDINEENTFKDDINDLKIFIDENGLEIDKNLRYIVKGFSEQYEFEAAEKIAHSIDDDKERAYSYLHIAENMYNFGHQKEKADKYIDKAFELLEPLFQELWDKRNAIEDQNTQYEFFRNNIKNIVYAIYTIPIILAKSHQIKKLSDIYNKITYLIKLNSMDYDREFYPFLFEELKEKNYDLFIPTLEIYSLFYDIFYYYLSISNEDTLEFVQNEENKLDKEFNEKGTNDYLNYLNSKNSIAHYYANKNQPIKAEKIFNEISNGVIELKEKNYGMIPYINSLILGYAKIGNEDKVFEHIDMLKDETQKRDIVSKAIKMMAKFKLINDKNLGFIRKLVNYIINDDNNLYDVALSLLDALENNDDKIEALQMLDLTGDYDV